MPWRSITNGNGLIITIVLKNTIELSIRTQVHHQVRGNLQALYVEGLSDVPHKSKLWIRPKPQLATTMKMKSHGRLDTT